MGTLFIIATPIGNLGDVTIRAIETLRLCDIVLSEDTRVTVRLLERYEISVPLESYREQVHRKKIGHIVDMLREGKRVGLVSDAGTPGICDPGSWLVRDILAAEPSVKIVPIPGPVALATALSASGMPSDEFLFLGFPPHKKGRATFFRDALESPRTVVFYESTHRIEKALAAIQELDPDRTLCVGREITKIYETFYRGTAADVSAALAKTSTRGEFVVMIAGKR